LNHGNEQRVLVIDPNAHIRRLIATLLGALAIRDVTEARTSEAAVPRLLHHHPDLVILDFTGDTTDSVLFVHRLRRGEFGDARIPVLALAESSHHALLEQAWEAGIDEVVAKPLSAIEMIERAAQLLRNRRTAQVSAIAAAE
jgi:two-component system, OmpR family, phosphate regulon response regulator PhoB